MSKYKNIINPFTGTLQKVFSGDLVTFKAGVVSVGNLPTEGNEKGDGRITNDTGHLYIWDGSVWQDQGDLVDLKWASIENKPSSSVANIDDAVDKKHEHANKTEIDLVTDGDHDVRTDNPHSVDVGEGHITILPLSYNSIIQGSWAMSLQASRFLNGYMYNPSNANGDAMNFKVTLNKGTYSLIVLGDKTINKAICGIDIDAVNVANFDQYGASVANVVYRQDNIVVASSGLKDLKVYVNEKNPLSTNYYISCGFVSLWRTL